MKSAAIALAATALVVAARAEQPYAQDRIVWNKPAAPFHIVGNVYYVGTAGISVYLIETRKGVIVIDAALPESVPHIEKNIKALGFNLKDIKILLAGHAHFDHAGGLAALKRDSGARLIASAADKPVLETGTIDYGPCKDVPFDPVKVDRVVKDGDRISLGGITLTAHVTPGHTRGCTSWTMPVVENGKKHSILFACSLTVGGNQLVGNPAYPNAVGDFRYSFAKMKSFGADILLTQHPYNADELGKAARVKAGGPNPFVNPDDLHRYVEAAERDFDAELARQSAKP
jgi:metallo-beta-lactamase class B